jgi:putative transcriptional regulator
MTRVFGIFCAAVAVSALLRAQPEAPHLEAGRILVASEESPDPYFAQTVILLVHYGERGVVGLILNRRTKVEVSRIFPGVPGAKDRPDPVYSGGPVTLGVMALLRSQNTPDKAAHVFGDVQAIVDKDLLEETVSSGKSPSMFRVYVGYAGWTGPQLRGEIERGFWHVLRGSSTAVFDPNPDTEWVRLNRKTLPRVRLRDNTTHAEHYLAVYNGGPADGSAEPQGNHAGHDSGRGF